MIDLTTPRQKLSPLDIQRVIPFYLYNFQKLGRKQGSHN